MASSYGMTSTKSTCHQHDSAVWHWRKRWVHTQPSRIMSWIVEGSLEVKLPTIWTDEKQSRAEAARRGRLEERRSEEKESGRKKMQMREKLGKSRNTVFFSIICGSGGSKSRLAKAAGAEPAGHRSDEKLHAVVARSTFPSQNVQNTPGSDHFWKLRCRKKCTPLWREAHVQVKMYKTPQLRTTFGS